MAQVERAVPSPAEPPALEVAAVKVSVSNAVHVEVGGDDSLFEAGERDRHLERRSRRVASLDGAVVQRSLFVARERRPRRTIDAGGEGVRIVRGPAGEPEDRAVARIEDDSGAIESDRIEPVFDGFLDVVVYGELQPLPFGRLVFIQRPNLATDAVHDDTLGAVMPHEHRVVNLFDPRL